MRTSSFTSLRISLLAALGVSAVHCGGTVENQGSSSGSGQGGGSSQNTTSAQSTGNGGGNSSAQSGSGGSTGIGGSGGSAAAPCDGKAVPIITPDGKGTGFAKCPDGTIHRVEVVECDSSITLPPCTGMEDVIDCTKDADCMGGPHGTCGHFDSGFEAAGSVCGCAYSCAQDSECAAGSVCVCNGVVDTGKSWATCAPTDCVTNTDCASGECGITSYFDGCGYSVQMACRADTDICRLDSDCPAGTTCVTAFSSANYTCEYVNCAIGRPLLVAGEARTAPTARRPDWSDASLSPDLTMSPDVRAELAARWTEIAALEHASIASFARFSMELLALGAPPDLLHEAQRAASDEIEHARIAYRLAGAYGGRPVGPAPLDLTSVGLAADRLEMIRGLIEEACVGETLGVAEALAIGADVQDPVLAGVYSRIAADEQRHAELAWRTLKWLLQGAGDDIRRFAADTFERAIKAAERDPAPRASAVAREHGLLSATEIGALRRQALREVVRPCARALLGSDSPIEAAPGH